jgi:hypothetical protein
MTPRLIFKPSIAHCRIRLWSKGYPAQRSRLGSNLVAMCPSASLAVVSRQWLVRWSSVFGLEFVCLLGQLGE